MDKRIGLIEKATSAGGSALTAVASLRNAAPRLWERPEDSHPPLGDFVTIDGTQVHYLMLGNQIGNRPPVVMIHGAGGNIRDLSFGLAGKIAQTHRVILFDRPGHGYTDIIHRRGETPQEQAVLLKAAADHLNIPNAIIAGYSLGGAVALAWGLDYAESTKALMLISPVTHVWHGRLSPIYSLAGHPLTSSIFTRTIGTLTPSSIIESTLDSVFRPLDPPKGYLDFVGAGLAMRPSCLQANARQVLVLKPSIDTMSQRYGELQMPISIVQGASDHSVPASVHADVFTDGVAHAHYQRISGVGHSTQHHAHAEILAEIARLTELSSGH